ncbi:MAG: 4-hydroxythreonine-4-phosphate dehydrogenase PdxA [Deltaproteobacteria bacterium]|nr:4-hydroxythreonine-4-phosphate dehydrogenase PdxA [Deltaproteobacteria bacterium]
MNSKPTIGIFTGDPKGVGPEIVAKLMQEPGIVSMADYKIFGPEKSNPSLNDKQAADLTIKGLRQVVAAASRGEFDRFVTGPVNKKRLCLVDPRFIGVTEFLVDVAHTPATAMFVSKDLKVSLATRHLPLARVPYVLSAVEILQTIRMTDEALKKYFNILKPRIAVCGLNPHAGEGGKLGEEDEKIILPALTQARKDGLQVGGPFAGDTIFWFARQGKWDAVIAMYHDQGLAPIKTLAFQDAVQMTLGLPFLRLSVDHGTAEDLVGKNRADTSSFKAAIHLACQ